MADPTSPGGLRWLWLLIILLLVVAAIVWLTRPPKQARTMVPAPPFVVEPSGPAVPVTLPNTPMRNVPATPTATPSPAP